MSDAIATNVHIVKDHDSQIGYDTPGFFVPVSMRESVVIDADCVPENDRSVIQTGKRNLRFRLRLSQMGDTGLEPVTSSV